MLNSNLQDLVRLLPEYQTRVFEIISQIFTYLHIPEPESLSELVTKIDLQNIFSYVLS
jgi:hypothetical protein